MAGLHGPSGSLSDETRADGGDLKTATVQLSQQLRSAAAALSRIAGIGSGDLRWMCETIGERSL
jgi:hypothetical protein